MAVKFSISMKLIMNNSSSYIPGVPEGVYKWVGRLVGELGGVINIIFKNDHTRKYSGMLDPFAQVKMGLVTQIYSTSYKRIKSSLISTACGLLDIRLSIMIL